MPEACHLNHWWSEKLSAADKKGDKTKSKTGAEDIIVNIFKQR